LEWIEDACRGSQEGMVDGEWLMVIDRMNCSSDSIEEQFIFTGNLREECDSWRERKVREALIGDIDQPGVLDGA
jgi:hypothetical protein